MLGYQPSVRDVDSSRADNILNRGKYSMFFNDEKRNMFQYYTCNSVPVVPHNSGKLHIFPEDHSSRVPENVLDFTAGTAPNALQVQIKLQRI